MLQGKKVQWSSALQVLLILSGPLASIGLVNAQDYTVDQASDDFDPYIYYAVASHDPIGQEFTPTLDHVDIVEIKIGSSVGTHLQVLIREDDIYGDILASSTKLVATGYDNIERFEFDESVILVPNARYVIEVLQLTGTGSLSVGPENYYANGRLVVSGDPWDTWDTWFREGVHGSVPVDSISWGATKALFR